MVFLESDFFFFYWGVAQTVFYGFTVLLIPAKRTVLTKTAKMTKLDSTHWKQGLRSSDPRKRRKWRKSLRQRHGLEKTDLFFPDFSATMVCSWNWGFFCPEKKKRKNPKIVWHVSEKFTAPLLPPKNYHSNFLDYTTPFYFQELISVIISPPITPNQFWGFNKRNSQEITPPCLVPIRKCNITQSFTPTYSEGIN